MKNKKLLIIISVVAAVIIVAVVMASIFTVRNVNPVYHKFEGGQIISADGPSGQDILSFCGGKSSVFFSKTKLMEQLNEEFTQWHAFAIVRTNYNTLTVHFVKRQAVAQIDIKGASVYVDAFGRVVESPDNAAYVDITSAFTDMRDVDTIAYGKELQFKDGVNNERLRCVLDAVVATWKCYIEFTDMTSVLGEKNVFGFSESGDMTIKLPLGSQIIVKSPATNVSAHLVKAYGVYYNASNNMQRDGIVITVEENGSINSNI